MTPLLWVHSKDLENLRLREALPEAEIGHGSNREQFLAALPEAQVAAPGLQA
jgi:hypothetical protein